MAKKVLTITIPSYNTEAFIDKNLPKFLDKDILDELEILIVNDGSTDSTLDIARKYEKEYSSTVRVINKENGGHGSVINTGIREAKGKYFKIVDGDDWVNTTNLVRLINDLKNCAAEVVISPFCLFFDNTKKTKLIEYKQIKDSILYDINDVIADFDKISIHSVTFLTEMLRSNDVRVREKCYYEDNEYVLYSICGAKSIIYFNYPIEFYLTAQKNQSINNRNLYKNRLMFQKIMEDCIEWKSKKGNTLSEALDTYADNSIYRIIRTQYNIYIRNGFEKGSYDDFTIFNAQLKRNHLKEWKEVGNRNSYIKILQSGNKGVFGVQSIIMHLYNNAKGVN